MPGHPLHVDVLRNPRVRRVAAAHNRSAAQVALRWLIQQVTRMDRPSYTHTRRTHGGRAPLHEAPFVIRPRVWQDVVIVTSSAKRSHLQANLDVHSFKLSEDEMRVLADA